jgi:MYXO-CTERM domain-containing protein
VSCPVAEITGNTLIGGTNGFDGTSHPSNTFLDAKPTGKKVVIRPNVHEPGRAHIAIYNWDGDGSVFVDLASMNLKSGDSYSIRDAQNFFGAPVAEGTYDGAGVSVPMTGLAKQAPVGLSAPPHTGPEFGAFVLFSSPSGGTGGSGGSGGGGGSAGAAGSAGTAGSSGAGGSAGSGGAGASSGSGSGAAGGAPGQGGSGGNLPSSGESEDDGGCGCRTTGGSTHAGLLAGFALLGLMRRRRALHTSAA